MGAYGRGIWGASEIREHARACIGSKATVHMYGLNPPIFACAKRGKRWVRGSLGDPLRDERMY